jgi:hypothetical protein
MSHGLQHRYYAARSCVHPVGARTEEPQRRDERREEGVGESAEINCLSVTELQVKSQAASARGHSCPQQVGAVRGAQTYSERLGVRTLLRTRMSARRFGCGVAALRPSRLCGLTRFPTNARLHHGPRDP